MDPRKLTTTNEAAATATAATSATTTPTATWASYHDPLTKAKVVIHRDLFKLGIVVVAANSGYRAPVTWTDTEFKVKIDDRELCFATLPLATFNPKPSVDLDDKAVQSVLALARSLLTQLTEASISEAKATGNTLKTSSQAATTPEENPELKAQKKLQQKSIQEVLNLIKGLLKNSVSLEESEKALLSDSKSEQLALDLAESLSKHAASEEDKGKAPVATATTSTSRKPKRKNTATPAPKILQTISNLAKSLSKYVALIKEKKPAKVNTSLPDIKSTQAVLNLAKSLAAYVNKETPDPTKSDLENPENIQIIFNQNRRQEVFIALEGVPAYINLWQSMPSNHFAFTGLTHVHTTGCMFGSSLKAQDTLGGTYSLIKHYFQTYRDQKFDEILLDGHSPYEDDLARKDEALALFVKQFGDFSQNNKPVVLYHLPYYDYILFAAQLFIHNQITLEAFGSFCTYILEKKHELSERIKTIYEKHSLEIKIESPFENLFSPNLADTLISKFNLAHKSQDHIQMEDTSAAHLEIGKTILQELDLYDLAATEETGETAEAAILKREKDFVQKCLGKLSGNDKASESKTNKEHTKVWRDFLTLGVKEKPKTAKADESKTTKADEPKTAAHEKASPYRKAEELESIEDLFSVANPVMIGLAALASGTEKDKPIKMVSSVPTSEKPIQVGYADFCERSNKSNSSIQPYPPVLNATTIETFLSFSPKNPNGLIFYNQLDPACLRALIDKGLITTAVSNMRNVCSTKSIASAAYRGFGLFGHPQDTPEQISLDEVLKKQVEQPKRSLSSTLNTSR